MRVAALYDIHGNLPALEAVLEQVAGAGVDGIVVGGDLVFGPMSAAALERLTALATPVQFIFGNAEVAVLNEIADRPPDPRFPEAFRDVLRWEAAQMRPHEPVMSVWPKTLELSIEGVGQVLFCHATPRDENELFLRSTPEDVLRPIFEPTGADLVVCGHTHMQFDRTVGRVRVVNAGSVGMPFGEPGAYWLLLGPGVDLRHTPYDLAAAAARIRASDYPMASDFARGSVLQPPTEETMTQAFAAAEIKG